MIRIRALLVVAMGFACVLPAPAAQEKIPVPFTLEPIKAESAMPDSLRAAPTGTRLPIVWDFFAQPNYPRELERLGIGGDVLVEFVVNAHGYVIYAKVLEATDRRLGEAVLDRLRWVRPTTRGRKRGPDPALPARYLLPLGFAVAKDSAVREWQFEPRLEKKAPANLDLSFTKPLDLDPQFPGSAAALKVIAPGMTRLEVIDTIGQPATTRIERSGVRVWLYGKDYSAIEFSVLFDDDRVLEAHPGEVLKPKQKFTGGKKRLIADDIYVLH